jgi:CspA family cold shock protein
MAEKGTVKWFNFKKGFGFIENDAGGDDLFVHATKVKGNPLKDGDKVTFDISTDEKTGKPAAVEVDGGSGYPKKGRGKRPSKGKGKGKKGKDDDEKEEGEKEEE